MNESKIDTIKKRIENLLDALIPYPCWEQDPNFKDTPKRVAKYFFEYIQSKSQRDKEVEACFKSVFPTENKKMIISPQIKTFSMCPHHLLPVEYEVVIAYMPHGENPQVLGASKLTRIATAIAKFPILQEDYIDEIATAFKKHLPIEGIAIIVSGIHMCMRCRGIKSNGPFVMNYMDGCFKDNQKVREEFFNTIQYIKK